MKIVNQYRYIKPEYMSCEMFLLKNFIDGYMAQIFDEYIDVEFEGHKFMSIINCDYYLRLQYGDYMQLPPAEKRVGVMDSVKINFLQE